MVVDDGSPDNTREALAPYLDDSRVRLLRLPGNTGLGAALNFATEQARGRYIAYLPSDDVYYPEHLATLSEVLDREPGVYLAYGGVKWGHKQPTPTLLGAAAVGREAELLENPAPPTKRATSPAATCLPWCR